VKEMLLTRGPDKRPTAIPADELLIGVFHMPTSRSLAGNEPEMTPRAPRFSIRASCTNFYRVFGAISLAKLS
jgi:hypothetical protein